VLFETGETLPFTVVKAEEFLSLFSGCLRLKINDGVVCDIIVHSKEAVEEEDDGEASVFDFLVLVLRRAAPVETFEVAKAE